MTVRSLSTAICAVLLLGIGRIQAQQAPAADPQALKRQAEESQRQQHEQEKKNAEITGHLVDCKPVIVLIPDSLSMDGEGVPALKIRGGGEALLLQGGTLHYEDTRDFNQRILYYWFDPAANFSQTIKSKQAEFAAQDQGLSGEERKATELYLMQLGQCRTPADYEKLNGIWMYELNLKGNAALTMPQIDRLSAAYAARQKAGDDLLQALKSFEKKPDDQAGVTRIFKSLDQIGTALNFFQPTGDFFSAVQKRAMGVDPDSGAALGGHHHVIASASASASVGGGGDNFDEVTKKYDAERKASIANAPVKFTIKGSDAVNQAQVWARIADGLLTMYADPLPDKSGYSCAFVVSGKPWTAERLETAKYYPGTTDANKAFRKFIEESPTQIAYQIGSDVEKLREKAGPVPEDVQKRADAMIQEETDASLAAEQAYKAALAQPNDPKLQRELFNAMSASWRVTRKNSMLNMHEIYADSPGARSVPWLLSMDQYDIAHADDPPSSYASSGSRGSFSTLGGSMLTGSLTITGRPNGKKQYISVTASNETLGAAIDSVSDALKRLYHNHKLTFTVDPAATDRALKGMAEGTSADEVIQSLALRAGVNAAKDDKDPNHWILKP